MMLRSAARGRRGGAGHDDHASAYVLGAGGIHLDVMHTPVHPIDHQPDPRAHLVAAKPFVEHAADDAPGRVLAVQDVAGGMAVLRQPFALQRPVHGLDDVAAFAKLPQRRLGLWRYNPFAGLNLGRQPHTLQARALDQEGAVLTEGVAHVLVGTQVGKLPPPLLGDQHPIEPGEAIGSHLPLKLLRYLELGLAAQFPGNNLAGPFANAVGDIVAGDVESLAVLRDAAQEDMRVRASCVLVIDRDPVEFRPEVSFHLLHQVARGGAQIGQLRAVLGRDDEAELIPVIPAPAQESVPILYVTLRGIDLALRNILCYAVPFEVTQVCIHCLGADKLPPAGGSPLRVEFYYAGLHRHPPRPRARPAPVPAPRTPTFQTQRRRRAPAPRVEPAASLPGAEIPVRIAASAPDRPMDLTDEAGRASTRRADSALGYLPPTTIADLAGTDTKVVFLARHRTTIGSRTLSRKSRNAIRVTQRGNTCAGED
jgi:hypothetical protein